MEKQDKWMTYAVQINGALNELFEEDSPHYLGDDFFETADIAQFLHALANVVPAQLYEKVTGRGGSYLNFNHVANVLCFQYGELEKAE